MFEYDAQIALDHADMDEHCLRVEMPYSGILLLRGKGKFDQVETELTTPGGTVRYPVAVRRMSALSLEDIFEKRLYLLLPFFIFNFEGKLNRINGDPGELENFSDIYREILSRLELETEKERLSAFSKGVIISLIHKVAYKMTMKRENVQKRVGDIMGGRVLDLDIIRVHREGVEEGIKEGIENEHSNAINRLAEHYMSKDPAIDRNDAIEMARSILG